MSDPTAKVKLTKKGIQMIVSLTNGQVIPLHWDDRFYLANCPECGEEVWAKTQTDIADILEIHC